MSEIEYPEGTMGYERQRLAREIEALPWWAWWWKRRMRQGLRESQALVYRHQTEMVRRIASEGAESALRDSTDRRAQ